MKLLNHLKKLVKKWLYELLKEDDDLTDYKRNFSKYTIGYKK